MSGNGPSFLSRLGQGLLTYGAVSAIVYVLLRMAYAQFYSPLGLQPEEVGFSRAELLQQSLAGPILLILLSLAYKATIFLLVTAILPIIVFAALALFVSRVHMNGFKPPNRMTRIRNAIEFQGLPKITFRITFMIIVIVSIAMLLWTAGDIITDGYYQAATLGRKVADHGETVHTVYKNVDYIAGRDLHGAPYRVTLLDVRAQPVELVKDQKISTIDKDAVECMLYLGEADKVAVLYDVKNKKAVRLPAEGITIKTDLKPRALPRTCSPLPITE